MTLVLSREEKVHIHHIPSYLISINNTQGCCKNHTKGRIINVTLWKGNTKSTQVVPYT